MEMHQIRYFLALSEALSFSRAAEQCHVSQPSLTQAIKKLEEELGGALFTRERGQVRLTELGVTVRPNLELVYNQVQQAKTNANHYLKLEKTPLRIGVMVTVGPLCLAPFLAHFKREFPGVEVELHEGGLAELLKRLEGGALDVLVAAPLEEPGDGYLTVPLYSEPYVVIFHPGHRFEMQKTIRLVDMSGEAYVDRLSCELRDTVMAVCEEKKVELYATYRSEREDWVQGMVVARMGVAFMPEFSIVVDGLAHRPLVEPQVSRLVRAIALAGNAEPGVKALLNEAAQWRWLP